MTERYIGTKFKTQLIKKKLNATKRTHELIFWCGKFSELGLTPSYGKGSAGNLSFRAGRHFIITASYTDLSQVRAEDLVRITSFSLPRKSVHAQGLREPSSETLLHAAIYEARPDIGAVFHGHGDDILKADHLFVTTKRKAPYGSSFLIDQVLAVLDHYDFIVMKDHGFLALGKNMAGAGQRIKSIVRELSTSSKV
jgi:ribulose-5-phosphate 4-epimerase/fuculose-1-phosphate aldolase